MEDGRRRPLRRREVDVPRRDREAVRLADRRAGDDLGREREIERHPADDHDLLGVLLAEVGPLGADERRTGSPRRSRRRRSDPAGRRPRAARRSRPTVDDRVEARDVDLLDRRRADEVDALRLADREVARLVARVLREVGRVVELTRVDEDRHDRRRVVGSRPRASARDGRRGASPSSGRGRRAGARRRAPSRSSARVRRTPGQGVGREARRSSRSEVAVERDAADRDRAGRPVRACRGRATSSRIASSIRTVSAGPGNVPAATSAA